MTDPTVRAQVQALPERPGVYIMRDARGDVIYVGKARNLRSRVRSYFGSSRSLEPKVRALAEQVVTIDHLLTKNEAEALLLEATLVKRHQPPHNVRLKDDKHYPYLKVDVQNPWPRVTITRRVEADGARYFGPYASAGSVRRTLDVVKRLFPWRSCTKTITGDDPRPCLDYFIKRCIAPCTSYCTREEYDDVINQTLLFLEGRSSEVLDHVEHEMQASSEALDFERAARFRDQAQAIRRVTERQRMASTTHLDADVFALARSGDEACVQVFFVRGTVVADADYFTLEGTHDSSDAEVLGAFLAQFYESATYVPKQVLLSSQPADLEDLQLALRERRGAAVEIRIPERGELRALVDSAEENARQALATQRVRWLSDRNKTEAALSLLQDELDLPAPPRRLECYDISTNQGVDTVASLVVFVDGAPSRGEYRRFKIKTVEGQDDFASMREVLTRRFKRLAERRRQQFAKSTDPGDPLAPAAQLRAPGGEHIDDTDDSPTALPGGHRAGAPAPLDIIELATSGAPVAPTSVAEAFPTATQVFSNEHALPPSPIQWERGPGGEGRAAASYEAAAIEHNEASSPTSPSPVQRERGQASGGSRTSGVGEGAAAADLNANAYNDSLAVRDTGPFPSPSPAAVATFESDAMAKGRRGEVDDAPESSWDIVPDLVVIDGGKGQLGAALDVMLDLGLRDVPVCGLAKREEEVFVADVDEPIILPRNSQALYLLQRIRDEAHRFAITYHRSLRRQSTKRSALDSVPGIGPKRKRALLRKFGSVRALNEASVDEIAATVGFTRRLAETVKRSL